MFSRPTLTQLIARIRGDVQTKLSGSDAYLRRSPEGILATAVAGLAHLLHGHLVWLSRQLLPDKADAEFLVRWAGVFGMVKNAPSKATGTAPIAGVNGTICPDGTVWQRADGVRYVQQGDATIAGGVAAITLEAETAGASGNVDAGAKLSLVAPVAGITSSTTLTAALSGGADEETTEELRTRFLERLRNPPKGGGPGDYVGWAKEVAGVTRAWQWDRKYGAGTVAVGFVRDNDASLIPDAGEIATVAAHIAAVAPAAADVTVFGPVAVPQDFSITLSPDTAAVRTAVEAQLAAWYGRQAEPGMTVYRSVLIEAISRATGEEHHSLSVPAGDVAHDWNEIPTLGTITWL